LTDIDPVYPAEAGGLEGTVVLRLLISQTGAVESADVVRSQPAGLFDRSAVEAFSAARFSPGYLNGIAVKSQFTLEVHYTPTNRGGSVGGSR
jgi:protein TonB